MEFCNWVRYFGDYCFSTDCGCIQGINVRPKQKTCFCKKRVRRFIQTQDRELNEVTSVRVKGGKAYYLY